MDNKNTSILQVSYPEQLLLFEQTDDERQFSQSIHLYDAIPKYTWGNLKRVNGKYLDPLVREFEYQGKMYRATISPARIIENEGTPDEEVKDYFPSVREELVEDALRKLAGEGSGVFLEGEAAVRFTLYQLHEELKRMGHGYNIPDIKKALHICSKTNMDIQSGDGKTVVSSNMFVGLGLRTWDDWKKYGNTTEACVRFNPLVTRCIKDRTFRLINYDKCMSYKKAIARWLRKRLSRQFTQADFTNTYNIRASTIIRDSGMTPYKHMKDNIRQIKEYLDEMVEKQDLLGYAVDYVYGGQRKRKLVDATFTLQPHMNFIRETKRINRRYKDTQNAKVNPEELKAIAVDRMKQLAIYQ